MHTKGQTSRSEALPLALWASGGVVAFSLRTDLAPVGVEYAQAATAALALLFGAWAFWRHGGRQVTAAGLYCLASAMFVGFAGLYWWAEPQAVPDGIFMATTVGYWTTLGMYALFWRKAPTFERLHLTSTSVTGWGVWMGLAATGAGLATVVLNVGEAEQFTLGGMALLVAALVLHRAQGQRIVGRLILAAGVAVVFFEVASGARGRLNLVTLGLVAVVLTSARVDSRKMKAFVLGGMGPALAVLVWVRAQLGVQEVGEEYNGIGSVVSPLRDFGLLVRAHESGSFALGSGETFLTSILFWVPRSVWPEKPVGFGRQLTEILQPGLLSTNQSLAALNQGEWFYNFAWVGVVIGVIVIGLALSWLDRSLARITRNPVDSRRRLLWLVMVTLLLANIPNLMWVGSYTYVSRAGQQLLLLMVTALLFASTRRQGSQPAEVELARTVPPPV